MKKKDNKSILIIINSLKRDKARGTIAPHQIILLISIYNLNKTKAAQNLKLNVLNGEFSLVWEKYKSLIKTNNKDIVMPLKALNRKGYLTLLNSELSVLDFNHKELRNYKDFSKQIDNVKISPDIISAFKNSLSPKEELVSKIKY